ncbi:hypothetical protein [Pseudomonas frederiksbergensis]|uniref:DUF4234 domain-containing protein n=1 Tax=Pseudomonas frederiksbergensis TaxID=104087 RepID=A0A6L5BXG9_9PSED|nr:hypothetical protein [Pseudomonas frederiksbergensis]KAF2392067.1 hypothetical protein FX983_00015 [Pseudomonas frederiksbergensis]
MIALSDSPATVEFPGAATAPPDFYVVCKSKLALLFVSTSGFFLIYWFYRNWKLYRAATGNKVLPLFRTILGVFFVYSLFTKIDHRIGASNLKYRWYPRSLALAVILLACTGSALMWLPDVQIRFALSLLVLFLQTCCLLRVQNAINYLAGDVEGLGNSKLTFANGIWVALGLCWWGLAIIGFYVL